jgi:hypothetical protein
VSTVRPNPRRRLHPLDLGVEPVRARVAAVLISSFCKAASPRARSGRSSGTVRSSAAGEAGRADAGRRGPSCAHREDGWQRGTEGGHRHQRRGHEPVRRTRCGSGRAAGRRAGSGRALRSGGGGGHRRGDDMLHATPRVLCRVSSREGGQCAVRAKSPRCDGRRPLRPSCRLVRAAAQSAPRYARDEQARGGAGQRNSWC